MTDENLRQRARDLLKPLFDRPCSPEERVVTDQVEGYIRGLWREIKDRNSELQSVRSATIEECAKVVEKREKTFTDWADTYANILTQTAMAEAAMKSDVLREAAKSIRSLKNAASVERVMK